MIFCRLAIKALCGLIAGLMALSMLMATVIFYHVSGNGYLLASGVLLTLCALAWLGLLINCFGYHLATFTNDLCLMLDEMINGNDIPPFRADSETLFDRIRHRLNRLYGIMRQNQRACNCQRQELQMLVSDISHQVKMPISNLKMAVETLLTRPVSASEQQDFLQGIRSQTDKLDFLLQALVKTSRLETGAISLTKTNAPLFDTLALALSGIVYQAEQKSLTVQVDCPEDLSVPHDTKWTAEALFNILDNAVKYTPAGGKISISLEAWEMYVRLIITDTGKGIAESQQAAIFRRFYREEDVRSLPGVGIGLYLARQIITCQGGYIQVSSAVGQGSSFSVFLPWKD